MINPDCEITITRQAELLGMSRGSVYYLPREYGVMSSRPVHGTAQQRFRGKRCPSRDSVVHA